jgi:transposase-like protein
MIPVHYSRSSKPLSDRYLAFAEREEIAILRVQGYGVRAIARKLGRAPSTISRELRRNAATRSGGLEYRATTAQWHADRSLRRPKPAKLVANEILRGYVQERLAGAVTAPDGKDQWAEGGMERTASGTQAAPALGDGMEPGTDCQAPAARLSG